MVFSLSQIYADTGMGKKEKKRSKTTDWHHSKRNDQSSCCCFGVIKLGDRIRPCLLNRPAVRETGACEQVSNPLIPSLLAYVCTRSVCGWRIVSLRV